MARARSSHDGWPVSRLIRKPDRARGGADAEDRDNQDVSRHKSVMTDTRCCCKPGRSLCALTFNAHADNLRAVVLHDTSSISTSVIAESLSGRAYFAIREFILRGELPLGAPLSRRDLAHRLKMSLLPVSEALQRLEREGLVETRQRAGTRVRIPTRQDVEDQYVIREALESQSARLVAERATLSQLHELRRIAEQVDFLYDRSFDAEDDAEFMFTVHRQHFDLHMRIAEFADCKGLREEIENKQVLMLNWLYMVAAPGRRLPRHFHRDLVDAIASRDPERADREMRHHVRYALPELLRRIEAREVQGWRQRSSSSTESRRPTVGRRRKKSQHSKARPAS